MKVYRYTEDKWTKDHPTGAVAFQHLLKGDPQLPDNFMYILGRQDGDFAMPRHRHNFDQIRLPITGDMNLGNGLTLREGEIGYFPEGLPYGPQDDPLGSTAPGERVQLVLQFGGASGYGFMSIEQRRQAWKELEQFGRFEGPNFRWADGRVEWGLNAIWEHVFGTRLKYPRSRYKAPIIIDPKRFNWVSVKGASGVHRKFMGAFSERGATIEYVRVGAGVRWTSRDADARRLMVLLSGHGEADGTDVARMSAIGVEPGETLGFDAAEETVLFVIGLPPIQPPEVESDEYDLEEMPEKVDA